MAKDNVHIFPGITPYNMVPDVMIEGAKKADLEGVIILGVDKQGEFFFSSSYADGADVLWWLEMARLKLMDIGRGRDHA